MKDSVYKHPIYIAVVEIEYNTDKFATLVCKTFTDDLQLGLQKQYQNRITIDESSANIQEISSEMDGYIKNHLQIITNTKKVDLTYTGFKKQNNATLIYFKLNNINSVEKIEVRDSILYEVYNNQVGLIYATVNGNRKNRKLTNPQSEASFDF
jgi:hypothetical protein